MSKITNARKKLDFYNEKNQKLKELNRDLINLILLVIKSENGVISTIEDFKMGRR